MRERKHLGRVRERYRPFTRGVEGVEQEDEECDQAEMSIAAFWYPKAHACGQERPKHLREGEDEEAAASKGVDCPDGRPGEHEIDEAEAPGGEEGGYIAGACLLKDGRRVESNNVDCSELVMSDFIT